MGEVYTLAKAVIVFLPEADNASILVWGCGKNLTHAIALPLPGSVRNMVTGTFRPQGQSIRHSLILQPEGTAFVGSLTYQTGVKCMTYTFSMPQLATLELSIIKI